VLQPASYGPGALCNANERDVQPAPRSRARCRHRTLGLPQAQATDANGPILWVGRDVEPEAACQAPLFSADDRFAAPQSAQQMSGMGRTGALTVPFWAMPAGLLRDATGHRTLIARDRPLRDGQQLHEIRREAAIHVLPRTRPRAVGRCCRSFGRPTRGPRTRFDARQRMLGTAPRYFLVVIFLGVIGDEPRETPS